jgi:hypothetical protein
MKIHKSLKTALYCTVLFLFIGGIIAVSEQTRSELKNNTVVTQNKTLNQPINPVQPTGQMINPFSGNPVNITELENVTIVKNGTIQLPNNTSGMARYKAFSKARGDLIRELNMSHDEWFRIECKSNGECTYQVIKSRNI